MTETELIRSKPYTGKVIITILVILGLLVAATSIFDTYSYLSDNYNAHEHRYSCYQSKHVGDDRYLTCRYSDYGSATEYALDRGMEEYVSTLIAYVVVPLVFGLILRLMLKTFGMVITDKRIYGWSVFQLWRTDLPLNMLQSVSLIGFTGIHVRTAGGGILLFLVRNRKDLHATLCQQIIRNYAPAAPEVPAAAPFFTAKPANTDMNVEKELYQLKDQLDNGKISQDEYESLKNKLRNR